jgi:hypothetical protein
MKNYKERHHRLTKEKIDTEERLKVAKASLSKDQDTLMQLKTQGFGTTDLNREILDDIKTSISTEKTGGKIVTSTNKRLENLLIGLRQGGIGLYNRLLPFHSTLLNEEAPVLGEMDSTNAIQAASDTMEMINFTEKVLGKMLLEIGGIRFVDSRAGIGKDEVVGPDSPTEITNCRVLPKVSWYRNLVIHCFNFYPHFHKTRIWFPPPKTNAEDDAAKYDDATVGSSDDVPTRTNLKTTSEKHAEAHLMSEELKNKKKRIKKKHPPSQKDLDHVDVNQTDLEPKAVVTPQLQYSTSPTRSRQSGLNSRDDPMDRVQAFLTEVPPLD